MQRTITSDGKLSTPNTQQAKRKQSELTPEEMSNAGACSLPANMQLNDIVSIIQGSIQTVLDEKLKNLSTKADIEEVKQTMQDCCSQVGHLKMENEALKEEVKILKFEHQKDHQELMRLVDKNKQKNVVFRGIEKNGDLKENITKICAETMGIPDLVVKWVRKLYETDETVCGVAEFRTEEMANAVFNNAKKLKGTSVFVDKDLSDEKQQNKKVMLQLKTQLKSLNKDLKILVRNDRMRIDKKWLFWNKDKLLMCGSQNGKEFLKTIFNDKIDSINLCYMSLLNQKN